MAGGAITWQLRLHNGWEKALNALLVFNAVFQTIAFATGNMLILDEANHYSYTKLHLVYVVICLTVFFLTIIQFIFYGRNFERQNQGSLYMTVTLAVGGVSLQECLGGQVRVAYLSLAIGAALLYIRNGEFYQLAQDESIETQWELLMVDDLTGVGSRRAYSMALEGLTKSGVPDDLVIFCAGINGLKETNDTLGHAAGDKLIVAAADCIQGVLSSAGRCFRTGGDEFVALVHMSKEEAADAVAALERAASKYTLDAGQTLTFACGYVCARDWPGMEPHKLVRRADLAMYEAKEAYYLKEGKERRRS